MTDIAHDVAEAFVMARRAGRALPAYPGVFPATLDDAYRVQDAAIILAGGAVGGWKVGRINPEVAGQQRLAGPIFADSIVGGDPEPAMPVFANGFAAAEAEFLLRIVAVPPSGKTRFTLAEAAALIDAVAIGIEVASSPFPGINSNGPAVTISDFGNNNGLVVGAAVADWRTTDVRDWPVELTIDGQMVGRAFARDMLDGPFGAAAFLFGHAAARGIALSPGQWISSGAVTGVHAVRPGQRVTATFDGRYHVACTITARQEVAG